MNRRRRRGVGLALLALVAPLPSCGGQDTTVTVLAAASLTETFTQIAEEFERRHDGVEVRLSFDSSTTLAQQAVDGAPADVLATADPVAMQLAEAALTEAAQPFATNSMVLVVPADNPASIAEFADLARPGLDWVTCVETAPCGRSALALLDGSGITAQPVSREIDVKAVLARVTSREVDAGLVYATDALAAGEQVEAIDVPGSEEALSSYELATLEQSEEAELAADFVELVLSSSGQQILADAGFGSPSGATP